jgi:hypothetical protein
VTWHTEDRDGRPRAEFSWQGDDEGDDVCGRGWVALRDDGALDGHLFFQAHRSRTLRMIPVSSPDGSPTWPSSRKTGSFSGSSATIQPPCERNSYAASATKPCQRSPSVPRRTVADLLDAVARNACERERRAAAQRADEQDATRQRGCLAHQHEWQPDAVR